jgi:aminopeptidase 2
MLGAVVQIVTGSFTSNQSVEEIENFFKDKSIKGFNQGLAQSLDAIRAKANWIERDGQEVRTWLSDRGFFKGKL